MPTIGSLSVAEPGIAPKSHSRLQLAGEAIGVGWTGGRGDLNYVESQFNKEESPGEESFRSTAARVLGLVKLRGTLQDP